MLLVHMGQVKMAIILACFGGMQGVLYSMLKGAGSGEQQPYLLEHNLHLGVLCCIYETTTGGSLIKIPTRDQPSNDQYTEPASKRSEE